jgi:hypothetical protein
MSWPNISGNCQNVQGLLFPISIKSGAAWAAPLEKEEPSLCNSHKLFCTERSQRVGLLLGN